MILAEKSFIQKIIYVTKIIFGQKLFLDKTFQNKTKCTLDPGIFFFMKTNE